MLSARQLYFEAVKVGDELPPLVKPPVDRLQIARYAGAAQDWNPLSVDEQHARNAGFPGALVPAMISMGFLGELVVDWVRGARLRKFQARFVKIVWPGDVLTVRGRVIDRRFEAPGRYAADIETWAENQRGELVVRGVATFQLYYSQEDDARQRTGQPPLVVTREEEEARLAKLSRAMPPRPAAPISRPLAAPKPLPAPPAARPVVPAAQVPPLPPAHPAAPAAARPPVAPPPARAQAAPPPRPAPAPKSTPTPIPKPTPKPTPTPAPIPKPTPTPTPRPAKPAPKPKPPPKPRAAAKPAARPKAKSPPRAAQRPAPKARAARLVPRKAAKKRR